MISPVLKKVLVACNGTEASLEAAMYAIILAKQYNCMVKAVSVIDTSTVKKLQLNRVFISEEAKETEKHLTGDAEKNIAQVVKLAKSKHVNIQTEILSGAVWAQIIKAADEFGADLILIGSTKKFSGTKDVIHSRLGDHESEIIASAKCSVMVVRDPFIEKKFKLM